MTVPALPEALQRKLDTLPDGPGVYLWRDAQGEVLYVGKAKRLKSRVRSYFATDFADSARNRVLQRLIADVETIVVASEAQSLILENTLIKESRPRFNVRLKDDKSYPSIAVTLNEPFPRVLVTRRRNIPGARNVAAAGHQDTGERLVEGDGDRRIALVVLEPDVEPGAGLLDEGVFENQGLGFAGDDDRLHIGDEPLQHPIPCAVREIGREVATHPALEALGLPHVQDLSLGIAPQVDPRSVRECIQLSLQSLGKCRNRHTSLKVNGPGWRAGCRGPGPDGQPIGRTPRRPRPRSGRDTPARTRPAASSRLRSDVPAPATPSGVPRRPQHRCWRRPRASPRPRRVGRSGRCAR